jgi:Ca2+-binding EF-hand superfamily protein
MGTGITTISSMCCCSVTCRSQVDSVTEKMVKRAIADITRNSNVMDNGSDVWVEISDLPGILTAAGCAATKFSVEAALTSLDSILPGIESESICLQELLAVYSIHTRLPVPEQKQTEKHSATTNSVLNKETTTWRYKGANTTMVPGSSASSDARNFISLPSRASVAAGPKMTEHEIRRLFKKLDISGEQKLTFMGIKTALEVYSNPSDQVPAVDDAYIRDWIRTFDKGSKGYIDFNDFFAIFEDIGSRNDVKLPIGASESGKQTLGSTTNTPNEDVLRRLVLFL